MSLCRRTMLLSAILVPCVFLLTTPVEAVRSRNAYEEKVDKSELIGVLKKLRERLNNEKEAEEKHVYDSIHDTFNEERSVDDVLEALELGSQRSGLRSMRRGGAVRQYQLPGTTLTKEQQTKLVDAMNAKRRSVKAGDMYKLHWNARLAGLAQMWSSKCNFVHSNDPYNYNEFDNFTTLGANLWAYQGQFDGEMIVNSWYSDKKNFNRITQNCESDTSCGGYKQLVTAYTTDVGCGQTTCSTISSLQNANFIVCYFAPPGNYKDVSTFTVGQPCTLCSKGQFYCNDGLCDSTCTAPGANCACQASCQQCGKVTSDCKCTCQAGSYGVNCGKACADYDPKCGLAPGWKQPDCANEFFNFVRDGCPKMCNMCTAGTPKCP